MGITPDHFLEEYNPMYEKGLELIKPYTTQLTHFDISAFQILIVNNSSNPYISDQKWQGVLHSATVIGAAPKPRIINSTCVYPLAFGEISAVPKDHQDFFLAESELTPYQN